MILIRISVSHNVLFQTYSHPLSSALAVVAAQCMRSFWERHTDPPFPHHHVLMTALGVEYIVPFLERTKPRLFLSPFSTLQKFWSYTLSAPVGFSPGQPTLGMWLQRPQSGAGGGSEVPSPRPVSRVGSVPLVWVIHVTSPSFFSLFIGNFPDSWEHNVKCDFKTTLWAITKHVEAFWNIQK